MQNSGAPRPPLPPTAQGASSQSVAPAPAAPGAGGGSAPQSSPRRHYADSERITRILQSMGVNHFDPKVVSVLREFLFFYSADVLERATTVSQYASKPIIDPDDIKVAIKLKIAHNKEFSHRPDRATLEKWAEHKNACPMPNIPNRAGIPLPQANSATCLGAPLQAMMQRTLLCACACGVRCPVLTERACDQERFCLNAVNFQILPQDPKVVAAEKQAQQQQQAAQAPKKGRGRYGAKPAKKTINVVIKFPKR